MVNTIKLIKFGASWCQPCKTVDPIIEKFKDKKLCEVESVDIDEQPERAEFFGVKTIPFFAWLKSDKLVKVSYGMTTLDKLEETVAELSDTP